MRPVSLEFVSQSEQQTASIAAGIAGLLQPGDAIFLVGQLGTGKTCFIRHACISLGVREQVTSPSYTMAQTYTGKITVHHLDLYRLSDFTIEDATDFEPYFETGAITFVEWPEFAEYFIQQPAMIVKMEHVDLNSRRISIVSERDDLRQELERLFASAGH